LWAVFGLIAGAIAKFVMPGKELVQNYLAKLAVSPMLSL
jgi:hypothetical protein